MNGTIGATVNIPLKLLSSSDVEIIKNHLTLRRNVSKSFFFGAAKTALEPIFFFRIVDGAIVLPRKFGIEYAAAKGIFLDDLRSEGSQISIQFNVEAQQRKPELKVQQDAIVSDVVQNLQCLPWHSGILQSGTGTGKTAMGALLISRMQRQALVVVHTEFLIDQWKKELLHFTDLKEEDIGYIWQEDREVANKKVVLAMLQTIIRREFTPKERAAFGLVLFDEVQHLPAEKFSEALLKFDAKYVVGLSATPNRYDGLDVLLSLGLGKTLNRNIMSPQLVPDVYIIKHQATIPPAAYLKHIIDAQGKSRTVANLGKLVVLLTRIASRNALIVDYVLRAAKAGRKILVYSGRINHLNALKAVVDQTLSGKTSLFIGGLSKNEREVAKTAQVMFCTYQYAKEALDVPDRDCLIFATPVSFVKQVIGRILRSSEDKKPPVIVDIVDVGVPKLRVMAGSRAQEYRSLRAKIHLPNGQKVN